MISLTQDMRATSLLSSEAAFPVALRDVQYVSDDGISVPIPSRKAVVNLATNRALAVVSDRYTLVNHSEVLGSIERMLKRLNLEKAPRRVHLEGGGRKVHALFKLEDREFDIGRREKDILCPMIRIINSYAADSRIIMELGAFRFVCTNLSVGGGGVFASGFRSIHAGEIDTQDTARKMGETIEQFPAMVETFRAWQDVSWTAKRSGGILKALSGVPKRHLDVIAKRWKLGDDEGRGKAPNVWRAYNIATRYATHESRTAKVAFGLLRRVNDAFTNIDLN